MEKITRELGDFFLVNIFFMGEFKELEFLF